MQLVIAAHGRGEDPATWSGIPLRLGEALEELGHEVVHVSADPPRPVLRAAVAGVRLAGVRQPGASHGPQLAALRSRVVSARMRRQAHDLVLQLDTGFRLPAGTRYATFHDMTVAQGAAVGWSDPALMSRRPRAAWVERDRAICRAAVACCAASTWAADSIATDYGVDAGRVHTVGFGRNVSPVAGLSRNWSTPRFLFVGREWDRKNGAAVVRAFARLRQEQPQAQLVLVGDHPAVTADGVVDLGHLRPGDAADGARLAAAYADATCFVLPSVMEPFGIAYLEAGAAGLPSIGTSVGGAASAVGDGGVLVDPGDDEALLTALRRLSDPGLAQELGARARAHSDRYTWSAVAGRIMSACVGYSR